MRHEIKICMGSSCFARGNEQNLALIENYIKNSGLEAAIELVGARCENECTIGPNINIDGKSFSEVSAEKLQGIMDGLKNE